MGGGIKWDHPNPHLSPGLGAAGVVVHHIAVAAVAAAVVVVQL